MMSGAFLAMLGGLGGCTGAVVAAPEPQQVPVLDVMVRKPFPDEAIDQQCSYIRPMRAGETLANYVSVVADKVPAPVTDLDCFLAGRAREAPAPGMSARYYFANAFLHVRAWRSLVGRDIGDVRRRTGLAHVGKTAEIYYFHASAAAANEKVDCGQALASKALRAGLPSAFLLWKNIEDQRKHPDGPFVPRRGCAHPNFLSLINE